MGCRSHTCRGSEWGICLFITKTDRWAHLPLQGNRATRSEECLSCNAILFFCLPVFNMFSLFLLCPSVWNLWHSCTDATHRSFMLHVWLTGDRVFVQCYPSNTAGIPAKETPDPARHRCKTPLTKRFWDLTACFDWQSAKLEAQPGNVIACLFSHSWYLCWHETAWRRGTWRKLAQQCVITLNLFAWKIHLVWFSSLKKHCSVFFSNGSYLRRGGSRCAQWTESFCILKPHW